MKLQDLCLSIALPLLVTVPVHAQDIYKCADGDGRITYSNVPTKSCRKLVLDPVNLAPAAKPPAARVATPPGFPKVDDQTQKSRDGDRRRILEGELAAEQKNAEQAKKDLAEQEGSSCPANVCRVVRSAVARCRSVSSSTATRWPCTSATSKPSRKRSAICAERRGLPVWPPDRLRLIPPAPPGWIDGHRGTAPLPPGGSSGSRARQKGRSGERQARR
jgi:hypothetical protein